MHGERNVGGGENSIYLLISGLDRERFTPIVFYSNENKIITQLKQDGVPTFPIALDKKITSVYRDEIRNNPFILLGYFWHLLAGIWTVSRELKQHNVDILHPHDNLSKIIGGIAAKISGVKVVAHCRDLLGKNLIEKFLIYYQLAFMNIIIAVSDSNRSVFKIGRWIPEKVQTIYNGIELSNYNPFSDTLLREELGIKLEATVLGIIGVFDLCKGHTYLFRALQQLQAEGVRNIVCLVIGDGREREELRQEVTAYGIDDSVRFLGYRNDVHVLLNAIDIVIMPSLQESFPRVALEAMAMKTPVIASEVGGLPESVQNGRTGIIVPPGDPKALSGAIRSLVENKELRKEMGEVGRERVNRLFSLDSNRRKTKEVYQRLLGTV